MGISVRRNNFSSMDKLGYSLYEDMIAAGFQLYRHYAFGERTPKTQPVNPFYDPDISPLEGKTGVYIFKATSKVDTLASVEPWYVIFHIHPNFIRSWVLTDSAFEFDRNNNLNIKQIPQHFLTENQFKEDDPEFEDGTEYQFGHISPNNLWHEESPDRYWLNLCPDESLWPEYESIELDDQGFRKLNAAPLSYNLTVSSYGFVLYIYSNAFAYTGRAYCWLAVQRLVDKTGKIDYTKGFNPVWCMFSQNGGGQAYDSLFGQVDSGDINPKGVQQFCVRERDVHYPTPAVSAVQPSSIGNAVMQNSQSVRHYENREWQVDLPTGFSTWRHKYPLYMDLIGVASADIASHTDIVKRVVFSDGYNRSYEAMLSNFKDDAGQRLYLLVDGPGTQTTVNIEMVAHAPITNITYGNTEEKLYKLVNIELTDLLGTIVRADRTLIVPFEIDPSSTAVENVHYTQTNQLGYMQFDVGDLKTGIYGKLSPQPGEQVSLIIIADTSGIHPSVPEITFTININWVE